MPPLRSHRLALCLAVCALAASRAHAQPSPLVLEVHGGVAVPTGSFADGASAGEGTEPGASLSVLFALPGSGRRGFYAGFSQHRFGCESAGCAAGGRYVATGFDAGLRFALLRGHRVMPWIRLGAITTRVETGDLGGENAGVSGLGFGGEVGAGLYVGGSSRVALNPGLRYAFVDTELPGGGTLAMRYLIAQVAVALAF